MLPYWHQICTLRNFKTRAKRYSVSIYFAARQIDDISRSNPHTHSRRANLRANIWRLVEDDCGNAAGSIKNYFVGCEKCITGRQHQRRAIRIRIEHPRVNVKVMPASQRAHDLLWIGSDV